MHANATLIHRLYTSLDRHDARTMLDCYDENAWFRDIAFDLRSRAEIGAVWRMITSGDIRATIETVEADDAAGFAKVIDQYTFRETGRQVRNSIESRFRFQNGKIIAHLDECDPHAWGAMAIGGIKGFVAGRLRFVRAWKARSLLRDFEREENLGNPQPRKER